MSLLCQLLHLLFSFLAFKVFGDSFVLFDSGLLDSVLNLERVTEEYSLVSHDSLDDLLKVDELSYLNSCLLIYL